MPEQIEPRVVATEDETSAAAPRQTEFGFVTAQPEPYRAASSTGQVELDFVTADRQPREPL